MKCSSSSRFRVGSSGLNGSDASLSMSGSGSSTESPAWEPVDEVGSILDLLIDRGFEVGTTGQQGDQGNDEERGEPHEHMAGQAGAR